MLLKQTFRSVRSCPVGVGLALVLLAVLPWCGGCRARKRPPVAPEPAIDYAQELPPGSVALRKASAAEYPDFYGALAADNLPATRTAVENSRAYLSRPGSRKAYPYLDITHDRAAATLVALAELLGAPPGDGTGFNRLIAQRFDVYRSIGAPSSGGGYTGKVLFTGYFTPTYDASLTRTATFRWPLYRRPADLVSDPATGETAGRKTADGKVVPYHTRAEIEGGGVLAGQELVWLKDRWEAYVVTVQGSARLRLRDGRVLELGYAGSNGREYGSPALKMVADGVLRKEQVSGDGLRKFFAGRPDLMDTYLWHNPRTVFFTERAGGPFGSLNVPVTPWATIATDKKVYPPALPAVVVTNVPSDAGAASGQRPFKGFMLDQDTGGAIRAAGRCDIYMGVGDAAERLAGRQYSEGELFYLALKEQFVPQYANRAPSGARAPQVPPH